MAKIAEMQEVSLDLLKPYERNAKIHGEEQIELLMNSIREFGFLSPCLVERGTFNLIAGHGRVEAAKRLGMEKVPCVFVEDITEEQRRAYILADNRLTELGTWDMDLVNIELGELDDMGFDVSVTGFDFEADPPEISDDEYEEPQNIEPRTKQGDLWQLGNHRLICGDSTDVAVFEKLFGGERAEICITSPPYNASHMDVALSEECGGGFNKSTQRKYINDDDERSEDEYFDFICSNIDAVMAFSDEVFYNIGVGAGSKTTIARLLDKYAANFKDLMYWEKENPMPVIIESVLASAVELIICLGNNGSRSFNHFNDRMFHGVIHGLSASTSNKYADIHKATFPVYLPAEIIQRFTTPNGTVLDCFGGTGTTMIACEQLGRKCFMSELEPTYCDVIIDRWEQLTGEKAVLLNG